MNASRSRHRSREARGRPDRVRAVRHHLAVRRDGRRRAAPRQPVRRAQSDRRADRRPRYEQRADRDGGLGLASSIDVPVFIVATVPSVDERFMMETAERPRAEAADLRDLSRMDRRQICLREHPGRNDRGGVDPRRRAAPAVHSRHRGGDRQRMAPARRARQTRVRQGEGEKRLFWRMNTTPRRLRVWTAIDPNVEYWAGCQKVYHSLQSARGVAALSHVWARWHAPRRRRECRYRTPLAPSTDKVRIVSWRTG